MKDSLPGLQYADAGWVNAVTEGFFWLSISAKMAVWKGERITYVCR